MMSVFRRLACSSVLGLLVSLPAHASDVGLDFNTHSFNLDGHTELGRVIPNSVNGELGAGFLYDTESEGDHLKFLHGDVLATGSAGPDLTAGVGLRGFYGDREHYSGGGVAVGGHLRYIFPRFNRLGVSGGLWYSPNVLTGGNFQHYFQYGADVEYQILRQASIYAGYRRVELPVEGPASGTRPRAPSQGFHIGLRLQF